MQRLRGANGFRLVGGVEDDRALGQDERGVVCVMRRLLAQVARERAREPDVLHPRDVGGTLIRLFRDEKRTAIRDTLDVRGDAQAVIARSEHGRRPHHRPGQVVVAGKQRLAPALAVHVVERFGRLALQRHEVFFAREPSVQIRIDACRDEHVSRAFELASHRFDVTRLKAGEVEEHVGFCLGQRTRELVLVCAVECDIARECSVRPILATRRDRLDATTHELFARRDPNESGSAQNQRARQSISRVTKSTSMPSISRSRSASSPARTTER